MKNTIKITKFLAAICLSTAAFSAAASDYLMVINTGNPTGATRIVADQYATEYRKHYKSVEALTPGGCLPVIAGIKENKGPTVVIWDNSVLFNDTCKSEFTKQKQIATFGGYYYLCTAKENNLTVQDFAEGRGRVALLPPFPFWDKWFKDMGTHLGVQYLTMPVGDSGKVILSLLSKETDWALVNSQRALVQIKENKLKCVASLNPAGENGYPYLGKYNKNFPNSSMLLGTNVYVTNASATEKKKIEDILLNFHRTSEFQNFILRSVLTDYTLADPVSKDKFYETMIKSSSVK
jgi:hypothetical protein